MRHLYSLIGHPQHPKLQRICQQLDFQEHVFTNMRKAIQHLKEHVPDVVVADFIYGYGNNYAGVNISNLDVFLYSLQRYAPHAKVIVLVDKSEREFADKLNTIIPLHAIFNHPVSEPELLTVLS